MDRNFLASLDKHPALALGTLWVSYESHVHHWLVVWNHGILWLSIYWEQYSHLTNIFQRGRSTTNQIKSWNTILCLVRNISSCHDWHTIFDYAYNIVSLESYLSWLSIFANCVVFAVPHFFPRSISTCRGQGQSHIYQALHSAQKKWDLWPGVASRPQHKPWNCFEDVWERPRIQLGAIHIYMILYVYIFINTHVDNYVHMYL